MADSSFRVDGLTTGVPFQSSSIFADFPRFTGKAGRVLIAPEIAKKLTLAAHAATPAEAAGLLCGRVLRDEAGPYTITIGYVVAPLNSGRPGSFHIPPEVTRDLRHRAARSYPAADVIGWWHSHVKPSGYSDTDRDHQRIWTSEHSVGMLVFLEHAGPVWGSVYLGPRSILLSEYSSHETGQHAPLLASGAPSCS
jgi:proteasome lid subunit RPN8/RPN11